MSDLKCYTNAKITTIDEQNETAECMIVKDGKFLYVGSENDCREYIDDSVEIIDLKEKRVLPGFIDAHMHIREYSKRYFGINLQGLNSIEKYQELIREYLKRNPDAEFVLGSGWPESIMPKGLKKEDLDVISTKIPIVMTSDTFHSVWVNSKVLEIAGVEKNKGDIENGIVERHEDGEPYGTLRENWTSVIEDLLPDFSVNEYKEAFIDYARYANSFGITGLRDAWLIVNSNAMTALRELAEEKAMKLYMKGVYEADPEGGTGQISDFVSAREKDSVNEYFSVDTVKIFCDGIIEGRTAYLLEPYLNNPKDAPDFKGDPIWSDSALNDIVAESMKQNFQVHIHALGDGAVRQSLDAFENAKNLDLLSERSIIAHNLLVAEKDFDRFKDLNLIALLNPYWIEVDDLYYSDLDVIGKERVESMYPVKSFLKRNIRCAMGTDFPVTDVPNILLGIELGVTRTISKYYHPWTTDYESGKYNFPLGDETENATLGEMVKMATLDSAYSMFLDDITGSIEAGKNADFIVLQNDIFNIPIEELTNTKVESTYFKGEQIYRLESDAK